MRITQKLRGGGRGPPKTTEETQFGLDLTAFVNKIKGLINKVCMETLKQIGTLTERNKSGIRHELTLARREIVQKLKDDYTGAQKDKTDIIREKAEVLRNNFNEYASTYKIELLKEVIHFRKALETKYLEKHEERRRRLEEHNAELLDEINNKIIKEIKETKTLDETNRKIIEEKHRKTFEERRIDPDEFLKKIDFDEIFNTEFNKTDIEQQDLEFAEEAVLNNEPAVNAHEPAAINNEPAVLNNEPVANAVEPAKNVDKSPKKYKKELDDCKKKLEKCKEELENLKSNAKTKKAPSLYDRVVVGKKKRSHKKQTREGAIVDLSKTTNLAEPTQQSDCHVKVKDIEDLHVYKKKEKKFYLCIVSNDNKHIPVPVSEWIQSNRNNISKTIIDNLDNCTPVDIADFGTSETLSLLQFAHNDVFTHAENDWEYKKELLDRLKTKIENEEISDAVTKYYTLSQENKTQIDDWRETNKLNLKGIQSWKPDKKKEFIQMIDSLLIPLSEEELKKLLSDYNNLSEKNQIKCSTWIRNRNLNDNPSKWKPSEQIEFRNYVESLMTSVPTAKLQEVTSHVKFLNGQYENENYKAADQVENILINDENENYLAAHEVENIWNNDENEDEHARPDVNELPTMVKNANMSNRQQGVASLNNFHNTTANVDARDAERRGREDFRANTKPIVDDDAEEEDDDEEGDMSGGRNRKSKRKQKRKNAKKTQRKK